MRRSYQYRKLERHARKPAELLLVPMIDIFTVLVTFLLMTAVFSRTVILQLNLPAAQTEFKEPPPGLQLEVMVRKDLLQVADRNTGPLATLSPTTPAATTTTALAEYLQAREGEVPGEDRCHHPARAGHRLRHAGAGDGPRARVRDRCRAPTSCRPSCSRTFPSAMRRRPMRHRAPRRRPRRHRWPRRHRPAGVNAMSMSNRARRMAQHHLRTVPTRS